jgi:parallel beta-helix repeat protein
VKPVSNWAIENVWMQHLICGVWMGDCHNGVIRNNRVYMTYADSINLNRGATTTLIENNYVRGAGDDGIAILAETAHPAASDDITLRKNSVIANWWGHNMDVAGGDSHLAEYNYLADNSHAGVFTYNRPSSFPMYNLTNASARRNVMVRGGSNYSSQKRGAIWIYSAYGTTGTNTTVDDNFIIEPLFRGIHITGSQNQVLTFNRNFIDGPSENPVYIDSGTNGSGTFNNNKAVNVPAGFSGLSDNSSTFSVTQSGNNWPP